MSNTGQNQIYCTPNTNARPTKTFVVQMFPLIDYETIVTQIVFKIHHQYVFQVIETTSTSSLR